MSSATGPPDGQARLELRNLTKHYELRGRSNRGKVVHAVDDVSLTLGAGQTVAIVGESGCGKSTLARCVVGTAVPTSGEILLDAVPINEEKQRRLHRREIQLISQNPFSALNRRRTLGDSLAQSLRTHGLVNGRTAVRSRVRELLDLVGLPADYADRYPASISGGETQRVVVARALAVEPSVLVLDEPTSSLDVSVKALIINLLLDLQRDLGLSYLMITHEIDVARHMADGLAVMYLGHLVETGPVARWRRPRHPYTQLLFASHAPPDPRHRTSVSISGELPSAITPPAGCRFHTRCPLVIDRCKQDNPVLEAVEPGHLVACHRGAEDIDLSAAAGDRHRKAETRPL